MLPRQQRLTRSGDIQLVYKTGKKTTHPLLRCYTRPAVTTRTTVVVSKRVHAHAVVRNRIKRRLRAGLSPLLKRLTRPHHIVIVVQAKATEAEAAALTAAVEASLHRQGLL